MNITSPTKSQIVKPEDPYNNKAKNLHNSDEVKNNLNKKISKTLNKGRMELSGEFSIEKILEKE